MHPPGTVKLVPLAPPSFDATVKRNTSSSRDNRFNWSAWLSPKFVRPNRLNRRLTERDGCSPTERRQRRASFDDDPLVGPDIDDQTLIGQCNSADQAFDAPRRKDTKSSTKKEKTNAQSSLLTSFLLSLNELLPEYCDHLMTAANMGSSNGAAKAVELLERGSNKSRQEKSPSKRSPQSHRLAYGSRSKSDAIHPRSPTFSFSQFLKQLSTGSPVNKMIQSEAYENLKHFVSPSPTRRWRQSSTESDYTPRSAPSSPSYFDKGMSKTTANEWERFVSPFLMLAAAEVLYGRMEHVIDPNSEAAFNAKNKPEKKTKSGDGDIASSHMPIFRFPFLDCLNNAIGEKAGPISLSTSSARKSPLVSFDFVSRNESPTGKFHRQSTCVSPSSTSNRGSKRLIAIYQQVRDDLIIVGEYLCDPVLGNKLQRDLIPPLPYQDDGSMTQLKPKLTKAAGENYLQNTDESDDRRVAAISLRDTLSHLICFIDARCILINIHAEMRNLASSGLPGISWVELAKRCDSVSSSNRLLARSGREAKGLKLAFEVVSHIESFDFFECTLSMRKLYVHLSPTCPIDDHDYLPIMWIRTSFSKIISFVKVIFAENALCSTAPQLQPQLPRTHSYTKKLNKREDPVPTAHCIFNFEVLASDLVSGNGDLPLAVIVVRKLEDNSWKPVFTKNSIQIKNEQSVDSIWPFALWGQIEKNLDQHIKSAISPSNYEVGSSSTDLEASVKSRIASLADNNLSIIGKKHTIPSDTKSSCSIATITDTSCLVVIRGAKRKVSDEEVKNFMDAAAPQLLPANLFSVDTALSAQSLMSSNIMVEPHHLRGIYTAKNYSLWDGLEWTGDKQKQMKVLNALGLRNSRNSPIIAPLKSPYVKDLKRRRRRPKPTMNHGHFALFLGSDLSQIM